MPITHKQTLTLDGVNYWKGQPIPDEVAEKHGLVEGSASTGSAADDSADKPLEEMTKDELYAVATDLEIEGRGDMNKAELLDAVQAAQAD